MRSPRRSPPAFSAGAPRLDYLIVQFAKRPIDRLDPEIVEILRLSAYQLLYLTRVPASAVVDDAVNLAKRAGKTSASGFVNAVLRAISRQRHTLPLPAAPADTSDRAAALDYLSVTLSHPRWLAARWYDRFGFDGAAAWLRVQQRRRAADAAREPAAARAPTSSRRRSRGRGSRHTRRRSRPMRLVVDERPSAARAGTR